ncbi:hypothetical protein WJX73_007373 [Symbiochloris irregularis]|uniref:SET domain-containing protein n=1 Tax=Symbiochloris irregularis TaxID=706552 RepID=A0AAW1PIU0_9CHLO
MSAGSADDLLRWADKEGILSRLCISASQIGNRGLKTAENLEAGDTCLTVPVSAIINSRRISETDLGRALLATNAVDPETLRLIWTMIDRPDAESRFSAFWTSLPERLLTGLTAPDEDAEMLASTPCYPQLAAARQHIAAHYEAMQPLLQSLVKAYPDFVKAQTVSWESFQWAIALWYSYAMEVEVEPGIVEACLVPVASLLNHSGTAHIRNFGRVDPETHSMRFRLDRPCSAGEEVFLSYGRLPNSSLLLYYGFALSSNPHDTIPLSLEVDDDHLQDKRLAAIEACHLSLDHDLRADGLESGLLDTLCVLSADEADLEDVLRNQGR